MDYHRQRFTDFSLLIYDKQSLVALLPLNKEADGSVTSHKGLTYGGLITDKKGRAEKVMNMFVCINTWLHDAGITRVVYRPVPWIYHEMPAEEDLYAPVRGKLDATVREMGKESGYAFILNADDNSLPFASPSMGEDITDALIAVLK